MMPPIANVVRLLSLMVALALAGCSPREPSLPEYRLAEGGIYTGELEHGVPQGSGVYRLPDGGRYEGQFKDGLFHGKGRYQSPRVGTIEGDFAQGLPVAGTHTTEYGNYSGPFEDWLYQGDGVWSASNGDRYSGEFRQGEFTGQGHYVGADGEQYLGEFAYWQFHGEGVLTKPNGDRIEARFEYGEPVGEGFYYRSADGAAPTKQAGEWRNGEFAKAGGQTAGELRADLAERALAEDHQRLSRSLAALSPERPGQTDMYFLGIGGDGRESVFGRDIRVARDGLQRRFGVENRTVLLLNDRRYPSLPLATRPSIAAALEAMDARMNPDEDLLAVHLVSHGAGDGSVILQQPGIALPDLTPDDFAAMLEKLNVRRKLIVVSACFSGHWLDRLESDDVLIITSARKDRASFGCGDDSEMTWFTKALYQEGQLALDDPQTDFAATAGLIRQWELEQGMTEEEWSYPQFFAGEGMQRWLRGNWPSDSHTRTVQP